MKKNDFICGIGTQAELCKYYLEINGYSVEGFLIEADYYDKLSMQNTEVRVFEDHIKSIFAEDYEYFVGIGPLHVNRVRSKYFDRLKEKNLSLVNVIAPGASVQNDLVLGEGIFIDQGSMVHPYVRLGNNVSIVHSAIGHHSIISNHAFISGSIIGGNVKIGEQVFIGMNSVIGDNLNIGKGTYIGMGCVIQENTEPYSVYSSHKAKKRNIDSRKLKI